MKTSYIMIIMLFTMTSVLAQNGSKNFIDQNYIEVTGTSEMEVIPDLIYLHITITEKDKKGRKSVEEQERKMMTAFDKIDKEINKQLSIISFSSTYIRYFFKKNDVKKTKQYELLLTDAAKLAPVYASLDDLDISNVSIAKLDHSKMESFKQETKVEAIKAAKEKATLYTKAIDQSIDRALFIQEMNATVSRNANILSNTVLNEVIVARGYSSKQENKSMPTIQLSKIHITASVLTRFELK